MSKTIIIGNDGYHPDAPVKGARPVEWLIDGKWVHKGWLMPEIKPTPFSWHRRSV